MSSKNDQAPATPSASASTPDPAPASPPAPDESASAAATDAGNPASRKVWAGAAVGIGSAALVAALLYAGRRKG